MESNITYKIFLQISVCSILVVKSVKIRVLYAFLSHLDSRKKDKLLEYIIRTHKIRKLRFQKLLYGVII